METWCRKKTKQTTNQDTGALVRARLRRVGIGVCPSLACLPVPGGQVPFSRTVEGLLPSSSCTTSVCGNLSSRRSMEAPLCRATFRTVFSLSRRSTDVALRMPCRILARLSELRWIATLPMYREDTGNTIWSLLRQKLSLGLR